MTLLLEFELVLAKKSLLPIYDFKQVLRNLHNHLYGGGPIKTESRLADEVAQIILCKIADEISSDHICNFYATPIELKTEAGRDKIHERILKLKPRTNGHSGNGFQLGSYWVAEAVKTLQFYSLLNSRSYVSPLADVYEIFNSGEFKGGRGQFFTPPVAVNLAFDILNPDANDLVIDPACGSGNFLSKVLHKFCASDSAFYISNQDVREQYIHNNVFGCDIENALVEVANEYLQLVAGGIKCNVVVGDSLNLASPHYTELTMGKFTKVFTNPPFGNNIEVTNPSILKQFDLGHQLQDGCPTPQLLKGQHPDRLFVELCLKLLAPGGEAAIVLPRQILSGDETNAVEIRKWLLKQATILAVIDFPPETFQPHTGTITSLLVLRKGLSPYPDPVFFAACDHVGHDRRGLPLYMMDLEGNTLRDEKKQPKLKDDTPKIAAAWKEFSETKSLRQQDSHSFLVETERIRNNNLHVLNAWAYNPNASEAFRRVMQLADSDQFEEIVLLKDICKEIFVPGRHKRKYVPLSDAAIPFLSTTQIFHIHDIDHKYQPLSFAADQGLLVEEGWILVTRSGSTGRVRYVNSELSQYAISDHCIRAVPDETKVDGGYLYAFLSSTVGQLLIDQGRYASVIETISHTRLAEIPIPLPSRQRQKEIGDLVRQAEEARANANKTRKTAIEMLDFLFS
ncbi:MAG: N-6 DNA methylase [Anaerolineae bacterium]|nr:N-6 DNA methylase [Anaerolineae bacterium]